MNDNLSEYCPKCKKRHLGFCDTDLTNDPLEEKWMSNDEIAKMARQKHPLQDRFDSPKEQAFWSGGIYVRDEAQEVISAKEREIKELKAMVGELIYQYERTTEYEVFGEQEFLSRAKKLVP